MTYTKRQPTVRLTCPSCHGIFERLAYYVRVKSARNKRAVLYCSRICSYDGRWGRSRFKIVRCMGCGRELRRMGHSLRRNKHGHFCSLRRCYDEWRREHLSGENSPAWKGGYFLWRGTAEWRRVRVLARKRDGGCIGCGIKREPWGYALDVHHTIPECDDLDTLVTLCRSCHAKWERKAGGCLIQ